MACEFEWGSQKCEKIVKIFNVICGLLLITLGILRFIYNEQLNNFTSIILSIYYIVFGGIVVSTEFNWNYVKSQFSFQQGYIGRGLFLIFAGVLCFDSIDLGKFVGLTSFIFGIYVCVFGIVCFLYGFYADKKLQNPQNNYANPIANNQNNNNNVGITRI